ncbi:MAG: hypothetical protein ACYSX0_07560 [Planctomycetota bacterium]
MGASLLLLLLFAPGARKEWSKTYPVGIRIPSTWKVLERDQGDKLLVVDGPRLGAGIPRAVLWRLPPKADEIGLDAVTTALREQMRSRAGTRITSVTRKRIGAFPCVRFGLLMGAKGARARFTVALMGDAFYALELSAAASHFPARTFDQMEQSLEVRWTEQEPVKGLKLKLPPGWKLKVEDKERWSVDAPRLGVGRSVLKVGRGEPPPDWRKRFSGAGPKLKFLGASRETMRADMQVPGRPKVRMLYLEGEGWSVVAMVPAPVWEDVFPTMETVLETVRSSP